LDEQDEISDNEGFLYYVDGSGNSKKVSVETFKRDVVLREIENNQPDGVDVKYSTPIVDWGGRIVVSGTATTKFYLPMDSFIVATNNPNYIRLDGISPANTVDGYFLESGCNVAAGTYISCAADCTFHIYPLSCSNVYTGEGVTFYSKISPWDFTNNIRTLEIGGVSPFKKADTLHPNSTPGTILDIGIYGTDADGVSTSNFMKNDIPKTAITEDMTGTSFKKYFLYCPLNPDNKYLCQFRMVSLINNKTFNMYPSPSHFGGANRNQVVFMGALSTNPPINVEDLKVSFMIAKIG
jgi:hypothetical protein